MIGLGELSDSGQSGTATLAAVDDERTRIVIELDGAPEEPEPAHIHEKPCDIIDPTPTDALKPVVNGRSKTVVGVSLKHLRSSAHSINVHRSGDLLDEYVACGTLGEESR